MLCLSDWSVPRASDASIALCRGGEGVGYWIGGERAPGRQTDCLTLDFIDSLISNS